MKTDPPRADIRLGHLCNNNCRFCCVSDQDNKELSSKEVYKNLEVSKPNAEKVVFTGGEPTIRRDIFNLVKYAKNLEYKYIAIITNGRMLSYDGFFDKLIDAGVTDICFSIPHIKEETYELLSQVKGSYKQLMKSINLAQNYDLNYSSISVITKYNYKILPEITKYLISLNEKFPRFFSELMFINPTDNAWKNRDELVPRYIDVVPYVRQSLILAEKNNLNLNVEAIPYCYMVGFYHRIVENLMAKERVFINPWGKPDYEYNQARRIEGKTKHDNCIKCKDNESCEGVWQNYVKIHGLEELKRFSEINKKLLYIGSACNQQCIMCTLDKFLRKEVPGFKGKEIINKPYSGYGKITDDLKSEIFQSNAEVLIIGGAEPTLRSDIVELIEYGKLCGTKNITINTNGSMLHDITLVSKLKKAGLNRLLISIHAHNEELGDKISQTKSNFIKTVKGIQNSLELGINVRLVHVIFSWNYKSLQNFVLFVKEKFKEIEAIDFVFIKPNHTDVEKVKDLIPKISDITSNLNFAFSLCNENNIDFTIANVPSCFIPGYDNNNLQLQELKRINSDNPYKEWMKKRLDNNEKDEYGYKSPECRYCIKNNICIGLLKEYSQLYGTDELKPIK